MVISGAPDTVASHAERIANTGLGMLLAAQEVTSPYDYGDKCSHIKVQGTCVSKYLAFL